MTTDDKIHPSSKPSAANNNNHPSLPATKSQLYGASRPATFRPRSHPNRNRDRDRSLCCTLCTYLCLLLIFLVVLVGAAATVFYLLFRPHPPSFTLTSLNISSSSSSSTLNFDLTLSAANPNSKILFSYQPASVSILAGADDTSVAGGTLSAFDQGERNTTVLMASVGSSETTTELRNDAVAAEVKKGVLAVKVKMVTKVEAKMWVLKTPPVGITVLCDGASVAVPAAPKKTAAAEDTAEDTAADTAKSECEVDMMRFKVWKWNV